jgi:hypothetical protein
VNSLFPVTQVTISTLLCGFYPLMHSILYIILQVRGGLQSRALTLNWHAYHLVLVSRATPKASLGVAFCSWRVHRPPSEVCAM